MDTDLFDYELPPEQIAQVPARHRDQSRLLCVNRRERRDQSPYLPGTPKPSSERKSTVPKCSFRLESPPKCEPTNWGQSRMLIAKSGTNTGRMVVSAKPGRKLQPGRTFKVKNRFTAEVLEKNEDGQSLVRFKCENDRAIDEIAEELGKLLYLHISAGRASLKIRKDTKLCTLTINTRLLLLHPLQASISRKDLFQRCRHKALLSMTYSFGLVWEHSNQSSPKNWKIIRCIQNYTKYLKLHF